MTQTAAKKEIKKTWNGYALFINGKITAASGTLSQLTKSYPTATVVDGGER